MEQSKNIAIVHCHMIKRLFFLVVLCFPALYGQAYDVLENGIYYNLSKGLKTASVTNEYGDEKSKSYSGSITIPASIIFNDQEYKVTSIGEYAFANCAELTSLAIPNSITTIGRAAFQCCM